MHSHAIQDMPEADNFGNPELHFAQNKYFDSDHLPLLTDITRTVFNPALQEVFILRGNYPEISEPLFLNEEQNLHVSRDRYVLLESNLPPPIH